MRISSWVMGAALTIACAGCGSDEPGAVVARRGGGTADDAGPGDADSRAQLSSSECDGASEPPAGGTDAPSSPSDDGGAMQSLDAGGAMQRFDAGSESVVLGAEGGEVCTASRLACLRIPPGALASDTVVQLERVAGTSWDLTEWGFAISPVDLTFAPAAVLTIDTSSIERPAPWLAPELMRAAGNDRWSSTSENLMLDGLRAEITQAGSYALTWEAVGMPDNCPVSS